MGLQLTEEEKEKAAEAKAKATTTTTTDKVITAGVVVLSSVLVGFGWRLGANLANRTVAPKRHHHAPPPSNNS